MSKTKNELYRTLDGAEPEGERYSELLEQCRIWNERDEYQKIIDALEAIPDQARTPETDSELARAYNNLADPGEPRGISMIRRALALLKPHEAYFEGEASAAAAVPFFRWPCQYTVDKGGPGVHISVPAPLLDRE